MSLSEALVYAPKPAGVAGHTFRHTVPSYNKSTFKPGETIMINIPTGRKGQFLNTKMSYLQFRIANMTATAAKTTKFDFSASSIISSIEVYHGSNLLESIREYNVLHTMWEDMIGSVEALKHSGTILAGVSSSNEREGQAIAPSASDYVAIPLLSGVVGVLMDKYLPTGDMSGGDIRLEITLASAADGMIATDAAAVDWQVHDVNLQLQYVELNSEAARMISAQNAGGYVISSESYANFANTLPSGVSNANVLIPARFSSLKTLFTVFRKQANIGTANAKSISERYNPFGNGSSRSAYFSIGGKNIPSTPITTDTEAFAELAKATHSFGAVNANTLIKYSTYKATDGTFLLGQDLEVQSHKSRVSEQGINTLSTNTHLITQFTSSLADALRVDTFAHYDFVLLIQGGVAQVRF